MLFCLKNAKKNYRKKLHLYILCVRPKFERGVEKGHRFSFQSVEFCLLRGGITGKWFNGQMTIRNPIILKEKVLLFHLLLYRLYILVNPGIY
jgi:hypothetical protein